MTRMPSLPYPLLTSIPANRKTSIEEHAVTTLDSLTAVLCSHPKVTRRQHQQLIGKWKKTKTLKIIRKAATELKLPLWRDALDQYISRFAAESWSVQHLMAVMMQDQLKNACRQPPPHSDKACRLSATQISGRPHCRRTPR